jgi:NAD(P)-dependent dehydrogenase (short-subunit alcohol dehydrogenase family)
MSIIITGASRGIGKAIAEHRFIKNQRRVLVARSPIKVDADDFNTLTVAGDVSDPATAKEAATKGRWYGPIRELVCAAGIGKSGKTETFRTEDWDEVINTNVRGCFNMINACLPDMLANGYGTIVLISSTAGITGYSRNAAYTASKHAIVGLAKSIAKEHGKRGIVCVPVCPGFVDTDMTARTIDGLIKHQGLTRDEAIKKIANVSPQQRIISAEEVAEAVEFILSGRCPSLSGNPMILSGGE